MLKKPKIDHFREQLLTALAEIDGSQTVATGGDAVVSLDQSRVGRLSRMDAMQQQAMASGLVERLQLQRRRVEAALHRINENRFGICCKCEDPIPVERIEADVATPFCSHCQEEIDERRKST